MSHTLRFFRTRCLDCGADFAIPDLGEFLYGQFIWYGERGDAFAYFDAIASPMFEHIRSLLRKAVGYPQSPSSHEIDRFHWVVAGCAEKITDQQLLPRRVCPSCRSRNLSVDDGDPVADRLVEEASYDEFLAKPALEQLSMVAQLWEQSGENRFTSP
ncbi:hypothetical protein DES53_1092 [Roseimicrobium gellanilyticum]|uniref:Uncharacterized protein n=1 Tax=Roseimicrobium gellanilyticum TaxID=748857 RepID=A0A366HCY9_9BACT|nr:hypothetical protein [Roseimicrobium gellanilyticum]RBP39575.1 hypothetical protein DES53_1092 [Roseimicrobium gellanilyticum]